jgi:hypothetical protein
MRTTGALAVWQGRWSQRGNRPPVEQGVGGDTRRGWTLSCCSRRSSQARVNSEDRR